MLVSTADRSHPESEKSSGEIAVSTTRPHVTSGHAEFASCIEQLPELLDRLWAAPAVPRRNHDRVPTAPGVYLFSEQGKPMYVGQTRNLYRRLAEHTRPSSRCNQASFAFLLALSEGEARGGKVVGTRDEVAVHPDFEPAFVEAKARVAAMEVRFLQLAEPKLRTLFEVFAAMVLGTEKFNDFETH